MYKEKRVNKIEEVDDRLQTMSLILDLIKNLQDVEKEKPNLSKMYKYFKSNLICILKNW